MKKIIVWSLTILIIGAIGWFFLRPNSKKISAEEYFAMGVIQGQQGNPDKAIEIYEQGLKLYPDNSQLICAKGFAYEDKYFKNKTTNSEFLNTAIENYKKGVSKDSNSVFCRGYLAEAYLYAGDYANSWKESNILINAGYNPPPQFLNELSTKMPNPNK